jgi:hypothetical protein
MWLWWLGIYGIMVLAGVTGVWTHHVYCVHRYGLCKACRYGITDHFHWSFSCLLWPMTGTAHLFGRIISYLAVRKELKQKEHDDLVQIPISMLTAPREESVQSDLLVRPERPDHKK